MPDITLDDYKAPKGEENAGLKRWQRQKSGYEVFMDQFVLTTADGLEDQLEQNLAGFELELPLDSAKGLSRISRPPVSYPWYMQLQM